MNEKEITFSDEENAPLELGIQLMETMDAPFWATAAGFAVSVSAVGAAYT